MEKEVEICITSYGDSEFVIEAADAAEQTLVTPEREGWTFSGWTDNKGDIVDPRSVYEGQELYASWIDDIKPSFSVTVTENMDSEQTVTLTMEDLGSGVASYYFGTQDPETGSVTYTPVSGSTTSVTVPDAGTYYFACKDASDNIAVISKTFYTLTVDLDGGTGIPAKIIGVEGSQISLTVPQKTGYTFTGWDQTPGTEFDGDYSIKAEYEANQYNVTFDTNGGVFSDDSTETASTVTYDSTYGEGTNGWPEEPTNEKGSFLGWYTAEVDGDEVTSQSVVTTAGDHTLYAHWKPYSVPVTVDNYTGTYDGTAHTATVTSPLPGATITYGTTEGNYDLSTIQAFTDAGLHTVYWKAVCDGYKDATGTATVEIYKADATISLSIDSTTGRIAVTTNSDGTLSATSSDVSIVDKVDIDGNKIAVLPTNGGGAGDVTITVTVNESTNYKPVSATTDVNISARLLPTSYSWWVPSGKYAYGCLNDKGAYVEDSNSMWKVTNDIYIAEAGYYYILGYSGRDPRFCLYNKAGSNGTNLYKALETNSGYAVYLDGPKYLKLSICITAGYTYEECDIRKITFK